MRPSLPLFGFVVVWVALIGWSSFEQQAIKTRVAATRPFGWPISTVRAGFLVGSNVGDLADNSSGDFRGV